MINNNQLFYECLRGPGSQRRNSTPNKQRNRIIRASMQIELNQTQNQDNSLADSAVRSMSIQRNSIQINKGDHIIKSITQPKKQGLMKKSSNTQNRYLQINDNQKQLILMDHTKDQSDIILKYLPEAQKFLNKANQQILQNWIPTLPQDERKQIEKNKKYFPIPRNIPFHEILDGLKVLYGQGKNKRLWPGEEALLMETIRLYIEKIVQNPKLLLHSVAFTLQQIIKLAGLEEILNYKLCMQQLECHWKMMITRFRYSGLAELNKKSWQYWLEQAQLRGHFLNLQNDNLLTQYLLKHQQID
ncbi:unnamed protein product [Paramecium octaurelia]|uniref:Uncharacterized protein n=1 Tax=Paramecium octaurelia TaxID=43137 RepID=A0A8S1TBR2_PAROT|nr:unnamed protein product [Paramecium octaurelia]